MINVVEQIDCGAPKVDGDNEPNKRLPFCCRLTVVVLSAQEMGEFGWLSGFRCDREHESRSDKVDPAQNGFEMRRLKASCQMNG